MTHPGGARGEDREIGTTLFLQLELISLDAAADLVIGNPTRCGLRQARVLEARDLGLAKPLLRGRRGRVVAVTVDDHAVSTISFPFQQLGSFSDGRSRGAKLQIGTGYKKLHTACSREQVATGAAAESECADGGQLRTVRGAQ